MANQSDLSLLSVQVASPFWNEYLRIPYWKDAANESDSILAEISLPLLDEVRERQGRTRSYWHGDFSGRRSAKALHLRHMSDQDWAWDFLSISGLKSRLQEPVISHRLLTRIQRRLRRQSDGSFDRWTQRVAALNPEHATPLLLDLPRRSELAQARGIGETDREALAEVLGRSLVRWRQADTVPSILQLVRVGTLSFDSSIRRTLAWLDPARFAATDVRYWPILAAQGLPDPQGQIDYQQRFASLGYLTTAQRRELAELLSLREEKGSAALLRPLASDPAASVRVAAARALGTLEASPQEAELLRLLDDVSVHVQRAAGESLAKLASATSVPTLKGRVLRDETPLYVVVPLLYALGHAGGYESAQTLLAAAQKFHGTAARHAYRAIGDLQLEFIVPQLLNHLRNYEDQLRTWRQHRDRRDTQPAAHTAATQPGGRDGGTRHPMSPDRSDSADPTVTRDSGKTAQIQPDTYALAELAMTLGRLAPKEQVLELLAHPLADVRLATALGLAVRMKLTWIEDLDRVRAESPNPLFRHAAYRAIDMSLDLLELLANEQEIQALQELEKSDRIRDKAGVLARITWTLDVLLPSRHQTGSGRGP